MVKASPDEHVSGLRFKAAAVGVTRPYTGNMTRERGAMA